MAVPKVVADFESQISSAISIGSTSFTLLSVTDDDGVALPDGKYYFTVDSSSSNKEYFTGTLTSATKTLASVKNVTRQGIEASGAVRAHRVGANIKITDFATYKDYIDQTTVAGVSNATTSQQGAVELPTQAETDARTATGGTGAGLAVTPDVLRATKYHDYAVDSVGSDAYAITITPAITAYSAGQEFTFKAGTANTGACTLNVSGLGAKTIKKNYNEDMVTGDIVANQIVKVVYDGTNMQFQNALPPIVPIVRTYLNAASPATWTKPTGLKYVVVEVQAGGGAGAGVDANDDEIQSTGAGGGYSRKTIAASSLGATETVTIGAGGTGVSGGSGNTGGSSSFGSHCSATGGGGGTKGGAGGVGGIGSGGDINISGGGGSSYGSYAAAASGGGPGGSSYFGGGANSISGNGDGNTGGVYGGGGGGARRNGSGAALTGGTGGAGIVIVTEFY